MFHPSGRSVDGHHAAFEKPLCDHCAVNTESDGFLVSFGGQLTTQHSAGNLFLWKEQGVLNYLGFKEVENTLQVIEVYTPSLHLGSGSVAYSQFLIGRKTLELEGISLLQKPRFGCKTNIYFTFRFVILNALEITFLKLCPVLEKRNTEQEPLGNTDLPRV